MQTIRRYMQHWLVASMFWASCLQPVDLLLKYASADGEAVNCSNFQIWTGFWDMLSLLQDLARGESVWPTLCANSMNRTIALRRRFAGPRIIEEASWIATDATPPIIGAVDWEARTYIREDDEETMNDYVEQDGL